MRRMQCETDVLWCVSADGRDNPVWAKGGRVVARVTQSGRKEADL
jgi:hypothetical protein